MKKWKKPTKYFYMMPNDVFSLGLHPFEFMILSYLVRRMNADSECWPSFQTMSKYTSKGKRQNNVYTIYSLENPEIYCDSGGTS